MLAKPKPLMTDCDAMNSNNSRVTTVTPASLGASDVARCSPGH
jgi:hypothetical protein